MEPKLPNFFLVGAPKAGTTSLCHYLDQHPDVFMSPIKAPNYFASEIRPARLSAEEQRRLEREAADLRRYLDGPMTEKRFGAIITEWEDYCKLFAGAASHNAVGEASDCYLWSESAPRNIAAKLPGARILAVLRDPADRAFSHHIHHVSIGLVRWSFREHIEASLKAPRDNFGPAYPFLEMGCYYGQIKRYMDAFGAEKVHVYLYEEYCGNPRSLLARIFENLGVDPGFGVDLSAKYLEFAVPRSPELLYWLRRAGVWPRLKALVPQRARARLRTAGFRARPQATVSPEDRAFLVDYYRDDIVRLSQLIGRDLTRWLQVNP